MRADPSGVSHVPGFILQKGRRIRGHVSEAQHKQQKLCSLCGMNRIYRSNDAGNGPGSCGVFAPENGSIARDHLCDCVPPVASC